MAKVFEKTSSSTAKLVSIEGMYPSKSCNHSMRRGTYNVGHLAQQNKVNWKLYREQKKNLKVFLNAFADNINKILDTKSPSIRLGLSESGAKNNSIGEALKNKDLLTYKALLSGF